MPTTADPGLALRVGQGTLRLEGELGFATVAGVLAEGREAIATSQGSPLVLDLSAVDKSDSAGVALLLDWLREARSRQVTLDIQGVPAQLAEIARLGGLASLIGLPEDAHAA